LGTTATAVIRRISPLIAARQASRVNCSRQLPDAAPGHSPDWEQG
jgi:hypothetical protein